MSLVAAIDAAVAFTQPKRGYLYQKELAEFRDLARTVCVLAREQGLEDALPKEEDLKRRIVWFPPIDQEFSYGEMAFHSHLHLPGHYSYEYRHLKEMDSDDDRHIYTDEVFVPVLAEWLDVMRMLRELVQAPPAVWLGMGKDQSGKLRIGDTTISLECQEARVVEALVGLGAASKPELEKQSGYADAVAVLKRVRTKYQLEPYISLPGGRGKGGYSTTIKPTK